MTRPQLLFTKDNKHYESYAFEDLSGPCKINEQPSRDNSATFLMRLVTSGTTAAFSRDID